MESRARLQAHTSLDKTVSVIVAFVDSTIAAAQRATATIPIVMLGPSDPVVAVFVASLAQPGGGSPSVRRPLIARPEEGFRCLGDLAVVKDGYPTPKPQT
jgi:hypothetical protein